MGIEPTSEAWEACFISLKTPKLAAFCRFSKFSNGFQAEPDATLRLTADRDKNLSAASGVAYIRLGAILTYLAAPNLAPKSIRNQDTTADALCSHKAVYGP